MKIGWNSHFSVPRDAFLERGPTGSRARRLADALYPAVPGLSRDPCTMQGGEYLAPSWLPGPFLWKLVGPWFRAR